MWLCMYMMERWENAVFLIGIVKVFDATNATRERREEIRKFLEHRRYQYMFVESLCNDARIITHNILVFFYTFYYFLLLCLTSLATQDNSTPQDNFYSSSPLLLMLCLQIAFYQKHRASGVVESPRNLAEVEHKKEK